MQVNLVIQKDNKETLSEKIKLGFSDAKKVYLVCGVLKEGGFNIIEEELLDTKIKPFFVIGVDKKNTTKSMLESILKLSKDSYYYINNYDVEFNSGILVIEKKDIAILYSLPATVSESTLETNVSEYLEIVYDLNDKDDKELYKQKVKEITSITSDEKFENLTKEKIEKLIEDKEIFSTRQYNHNVLSISELLGKTAAQKTEEIAVPQVEEKEIPKVDLSDIDLDIEMPEIDINIDVKEDKSKKVTKKENKKEEKVEKEEISLDIEEDIPSDKVLNFVDEMDVIDENNELYDEDLLDKKIDEDEVVDINELLFEKSDMKLQKKEKKEEKKEEDKIEVKKLNLNNISNLLIELPSRPSKGQDLKNVKVPNYIKTLIPDFFEMNDNAKNEVIDGSPYKLRDIQIEIVNAKTGEKFTDRNAKIMQKQGQTYTTFTTPAIENIDYSENDIVRIIKLSSDVYHMEFIPQDINEYKIWSKICNQKMKSSTRNYGMM